MAECVMVIAYQRPPIRLLYSFNVVSLFRYKLLEVRVLIFKFIYNRKYNFSFFDLTNIYW